MIGLGYATCNHGHLRYERLRVFQKGDYFTYILIPASFYDKRRLLPATATHSAKDDVLNAVIGCYCAVLDGGGVCACTV